MEGIPPASMLMEQLNLLNPIVGHHPCSSYSEGRVANLEETNNSNPVYKLVVGSHPLFVNWWPS